MVVLVAVALLAASYLQPVSAHLFISSPSPIPGSAPKDPLSGDGSNFPCHGVAFPGSGGVNMAVGSSQNLIFDDGNGLNTATHGGGSCQISITYETDPEKIKDPMNWYVIKSIEKGCPTNSVGNLDGNWAQPGGGTYSGSHQCSENSTNGVDCLNQFQFDIPSGMQNGQATLAWTWFNAVGNREMYMNCAAINIQGGQSDSSGMSQFPGMFVANLQASGLPEGCDTIGNSDVAFPFPGADLEIKLPSVRAGFSTTAQTTFSLITPSVGPSACQNVARNGYVAPTGGAISAASAPTTASSAAAAGSIPATTSNAASSNSYSNAAPTTMVVSTGAGGATSSAAGKPSISTNPKPNKGHTPKAKCAAGSIACKNINALVCSGQKHFGICDLNKCAVVQSVADGTMCKNGAITWADKKKRSNAHAHLAQHHRLSDLHRHAVHRR